MSDWAQTFTGKMFYPLEPRIEDIDIRDIAHALSLQCRFAGHTEEFYSVANHCLLVSKYVPSEFALEGLLHDSAEAYLVDVPRPIKHDVSMTGYREAEKRLEELIRVKYGLPIEMSPAVQAADRQMARTELRDLLKPEPMRWADGGDGVYPETIVPMPWRTAERKFLERFHELTKQRMVA